MVTSWFWVQYFSFLIGAIICFIIYKKKKIQIWGMVGSLLVMIFIVLSTFLYQKLFS
jgi:uncharacterized membrane protein YczE